MAFAEVVVNGHLMPGIEQGFGANRADIPSAAGDKNIHARQASHRGKLTQRKKPPSTGGAVREKRRIYRERETAALCRDAATPAIGEAQGWREGSVWAQ